LFHRCIFTHIFNDVATKNLDTFNAAPQKYRNVAVTYIY